MCRDHLAGDSERAAPASPLPLAGEGQGGAMKQNRCECSPSPTLPRTRGREHTELAARGTDSRQPALEIGVHERIVIEVRIGSADAVDLFLLSGPQCFVRVEAPDACEQPLSAQDFM